MSTWYDDCFTLLHYEHDYSPHDAPPPLSGFDPDQLTLALRRVRPDAVTYYAKGNQGYVPYLTRYGNQLPALSETPAHDVLALFREITQHEGIRFLIGYSGLIDHLAVNWRPGWLRIKSDYTAYPSRAICPNAGYVDELMLPQLDEILSYYSPDGIWVDADNWTVAPCYCSSCESDFQMLHERAAPLESTDGLWPEWLQFHRDSFNRYVDKVARYLHDRGQELVYATNAGFCTHQPETPGSGPDRLTWDLSPAFSLRQAGLEARFLDRRGAPFDLATPLFCTARPQRVGRLPALSAYRKTLDHLAQEASVILAHGGRWNLWLRAEPDDRLSERDHALAAEAVAWARERQPWCQGTESGAYIAVLHGDETHRKAGNGLYDPGPSLDRIRGAHQLLQELHQPYDILTEQRLRLELDRYRVLILPEQVALSPLLDEPIKRWVTEGGRLIATGRAAPRVNEDIPTFALEDVLGVQWTGRQSPTGWVQLGEEPLLVAVPTCHVRTIEAEGMASLLPSGREGAEPLEYPALTRSTFGEGEAYYIAFDLFTAYHRHQYPGLREVLGTVLERALPRPPLLTTAPPSVELTLRRKEGTLLVHCVNLNPGKSLAQNSPFIEAVPPSPGFSLTLALAREPASVRLQPGDTEPEWTYSGGALNVFIPPVHLHSVLVVEPGAAES